MSIYASAVSNGIGLAAALADRGDATTFNRVYGQFRDRLNARNNKHAGQLAISTARQDKILTNLEIQENRIQAQAHTKLAAAVAGATGGSVTDVLYESDKNANNALLASERHTEQTIEGMLAEVYRQQSVMLTDTKIKQPSLWAAGLMGIQGLELNDFKIGEALMNDPAARDKRLAAKHGITPQG